MSKVKHVDITPEQGVHVIHDFVVPGDANTLAELAGNPKIAIGKVAFRVSDTSFHICTDTAPALVWQQLGSGGGAGDVAGPASATDNAVARFDSTTGKLIQNSLVTVSDTGSISLPAAQTVDGRDVSVDGAALDSHVSNTSNPHSVTAAQAGAVPTSRTVSTTAPLTGGGALSGDLTLAISAATTSNAGSMSSADKTKLDGIQALADVTGYTSTPTTIYIDGVAGNDANDGTIGSPVATMARAAVLSPRFSSAAVVWLVATAGTYAFAVCTTLFSGSGRWYLRALPGTKTITRTGTCAAGTDANQIAESGLTVDAWIGHTLEITSGPATGYRRTIQNNTATSLVPCRRFEQQNATTTVVPVAGNTYQLTRPGVVVTGFTGDFSNLRLMIYDISFATVTTVPRFTDCRIFGSGVEIRGSVHQAFDQSIVKIGTIGWASDSFNTGVTAESVLFSDCGASSPGDNEVLGRERGCGLVYFDMGLNPTGVTSLRMNQTLFMAFGVFGPFLSQASVVKHAGMHWGLMNHTNGSLITVFNRGASSIGSVIRQAVITGNSTWGSAGILDMVVTAAATVGFTVSAGGFLQLVAGGNLDTTAAASALIVTRQDGKVVLAGAFTMTCSLVAAGAGTAGILLDQGSHISLNTNSAMTITNNSTAPVLEVGRACSVTNSTGTTPGMTFTGTGGALVSGGQYNQNGGTLTLAGPLVVEAEGVVRTLSTTTVSPASGDAVTVQNGGSFTQGGGVLTVTPTSGTALTVKSGGLASLRSGTNTVLTGTGSGVGCKTLGLGRVVFDGAPTSVTGPAGADLKVGQAAAVANATLAAAGDAITDGAGTSILRSA